MTPAKERALEALMHNTTLTAAAAQAGLSRKTLQRYMQNDAEFIERYNEEKDKLISGATDALQKVMNPAIEALAGIVEDEGINPAVRIQAARAVLDYALKLTETQDIISRLDALESMQMEDMRI